MIHRDAAPGVHRVEEAYTNWYLVEDGGRVTIVDAGFPRSWATLQQALRAIGRSPGDVEALVLTHAHFDHIGFAARARKELGIPVLAHERETSLLEHPRRYEHEEPILPYVLRERFFRRVLAAMTAKGALLGRPVSGATTYADGDELDVPGRPRVVFTPGHTFGHASIHLPDRDALIAGDAIVTLDPYTGRTGPRVVARAATADSAMGIRSLDAIEATAAQTLLGGHGEPWTGGAA
ncbi:MAG TPA: MBL fold metallo-hydrolase, partial [Thermoleophilaceae bacterium]|nr:MBL fold metallo-hydrolase [Thermoleophilaceae bacterium]